MITNERKQELTRLTDSGDTVSDLKATFTIEEVIFLITLCRNLMKEKHPEAQRIIYSLGSRIEDHVGWYSLRSEIFPVNSFVHEGQAYLFTTRRRAEIAAKKFIDLGYKVIIHDAEGADREDSVHVARRSGADDLVLDNGEDQAIVNSRFVRINPGAMYTWTRPEIRLTRAVTEYAIELTSKRRDRFDFTHLDFIRQMELVGVYYIASVEAPDVPLTLPPDYGLGDNLYCLFSQKQELIGVFTQYLDVVIKREPFSDIYNRLGGKYIVNAASTPVLFGPKTAEWSLEFRANYEQTYFEVKKYLGDVPDVKKLTDYIMAYDDILCEFLNGFTPDGFEYPQSNAASVENYTAEILQRIIAKTPANAYAMLSRMRTYPYAIDQLVSGEIKS